MPIRRLLAILALAVLCIGVPASALGDTTSAYSPPDGAVRVAPSNAGTVRTPQGVGECMGICSPTAAPSPGPSATPSGIDAAIESKVADAQKSLATPCGGVNDAFTQFIDDVYLLITFQGDGTGLAIIQGRVVSIGMSIFIFAFGFALIRFAKELSGQTLDKMIVESAWKMAGLLLGIIAINIAGGFYLQPTGFQKTPGAPATVLVRDAGTNFAAGDGKNGTQTGILQPLIAAALRKAGVDQKTVTVPRTPGTEIHYTSCIAAKIVAYSIVSGFSVKATGGSGGGSGVLNWAMGGTIDLVAGLIMAIIYLILTLPATICIFASGLFMANHLFVLNVNANLLGIVAIFTLGFLGHPATKQWGTPFFALLYGIFTTSFVLAFVNIIIACGGAIIEMEIKQGSLNMMGIAFGTAAMGAFVVSMAIRAPKLASIFSGKMGYDTADAIGGLAATAAAVSMVGKGVSMAAGALRSKFLPDRSIGGGKGAPAGRGSQNGTSTGGTPSSTPSGGPANGARPSPTATAGDPTKSSPQTKAGTQGSTSPTNATGKPGPKQNRDDAGTPKRVAKAGDTLRDRAAAAKATGDSRKQQTQTAKALENFASNLDNQSESARKKGDERLANNAAAISDAARELAAHAPSIDGTALSEATQALASAAESAHLVPPTEALHKSAAALAAVDDPDAKNAARKIDAAATTGSDSKYNAGRALADQARTAAASTSADSRNLQGTSLSRSIANAKNTALGKADQKTLGGKTAGVAARTLDSLTSAKELTPRAAAAVNAVGNVLSGALEGHATSEGTTAMLQAASQQFAAAAADPKIDRDTRAAYLQAATRAGAGANSIRQAVAAGEITASSSPSAPAISTTGVSPAPMGTGYGSASFAAQALPTATDNQQAQIHATAASAGWRDHSSAELRTGSPARADAANRIATAFQTIGRIGAPKNDTERQAYSMIYSASHALEHGTATTSEVAAMLSTSEMLMRSASQSDDSVRGLHLNTAAVQIGSTAAAVARIETAPATADTPIATYTATPASSPTNDKPDRSTSPRSPYRQNAPTPREKLGRQFGDAMRRLHQLHNSTNHHHHEPPRF